MAESRVDSLTEERDVLVSIPGSWEHTGGQGGAGSRRKAAL